MGAPAIVYEAFFQARVDFYANASHKSHLFSPHRLTLSALLFLVF